MALQALLIEDNRALAETVVSYLELEGIDCDYAATGSHGLSLAMANRFDAILLDINLPRLNGLQVCAALRDAGIDVPVLMLTARDTLEDKLAGFDAGTDDYLVKPFELRELAARVKALAKRRESTGSLLEIGPIKMDLARKVVSRAGSTLNLTPTGWKILELLMRASPNVVDRQSIERAVWGDTDLPDTDTLKVHLFKLRQQVDKPFGSNLIQTIASHGVALRLPHD